MDREREGERRGGRERVRNGGRDRQWDIIKKKTDLERH